MVVDMDLSARINGQAASQSAAVADNTLFHETDPDLVIFRLKKNNQNNESNLNNFFTRLAQSQFSGVSASQLKNAVATTKTASPSARTINYRAMNDNQVQEKIKPEVVNHSELKNIIASNQQVFQRCYEENLLKDELLSGNASIVLNIGKSANVMFKGIGQENIKKELQKCLSKRALAMNFSNQYQGKAIKFSLFFNN